MRGDTCHLPYGYVQGEQRPSRRAAASGAPGAATPEARTVETAYGSAQVKAVVLPSGEERLYPEYASVAKLAEAAHAPFQDVLRAVTAAATQA